MEKYVLREYYELCDGGVCQDFLTENEKRMVREQKAVFLSGVFQRANALNGNKRKYPREVLEREVENYKKLCRERRALGELDHPEDSVVNLKNVSHLVIDIWFEGDVVMGKLQVLDTPSGEILKSLVRSQVTIGVSSRGLGSVREEMGNSIVEEDFQLICFDIVQEPSTVNAFMKVVAENKNPSIFNKADKLNRMLNDILR